MTTIIVDACQNGHADYPDSITSGGMGPCIAVGLMFKSRARMLHSPCLQEEEREPNGRHTFFNKLDVEIPFSERGKTKVAVVGGIVCRSEPLHEQNRIIDARKFVISSLQSMGFSDIWMEWSNDDLTRILTIRTVTKEAVIERQLKTGPLVSIDRFPL